MAMPIGDGVASYAGPDSPLNKVAGLGFGNSANLGAIEHAYADRAAPVQADRPTRLEVAA